MEVVKAARHANQDVAERLREIAQRIEEADEQITGWAVVTSAVDGTTRSDWGGRDELRLIGAISTVKHNIIELARVSDE